MNYLFVSLLSLFCLCGLSAKTVKCNQHAQHAQSQKKYALYVTTGAKAHEFAYAKWGGCHITLAGFHRKHGSEAFLSKIPKIIKDNLVLESSWTPKQVKVEKWGRDWAVVFHSRTLDKIARQLAKEHFKKVKGPEFSQTPFHMILANIKDRQSGEVFAQSLREEKWFITVAEMTSSSHSCPQARWLRHFPL